MHFQNDYARKYRTFLIILSLFQIAVWPGPAQPQHGQTITDIHGPPDPETSKFTELNS